MPHDRHLPLAPFAGVRPPAPAWYDAAMATPAEAGRIAVEGAGIEWLAWGPAGAPGLLLVHGGWAHARWWSHIAPLLASRYRVAALSLSGMGRSDWRNRYAVTQYGRELRAVARAAGLHAAGSPVLIAHSFGCAVAAAELADPADWTNGAILIDGSIDMVAAAPPPSTERRRHRVFPTLEAGLARYRLIPAQPCANAYIVDGIARASLVPVDGGHAWAFDPALFDRLTRIDSRAAIRSTRRPLGFVRGDRSNIVPADHLAALQADLPALRTVTIVDAAHHILIDQPLALVAAIDGLLAGWPRHPPHA